ncbi:ABC transporter permease subunit [Parasulfitobacter algicola]|uniref:ABC transporter permease subunit n=1 Tax=Parasulfitobacter algicola TaxID=2614809 RepID=UPI001FEB5100|nr:ABC transporter permease subunit [Sulfitobacter algicola]
MVFGLLIGLLPYVRTTFTQFVAVTSMIPPLAVLPILFIVFGLGELPKVVLIVIGILPFLICDLSWREREIPREQIVKAETLGAST